MSYRWIMNFKKTTADMCRVFLHPRDSEGAHPDSVKGKESKGLDKEFIHVAFTCQAQGSLRYCRDSNTSPASSDKPVETGSTDASTCQYSFVLCMWEAASHLHLVFTQLKV